MKSALMASILISFTLLLGRLSGFIREALIASQLGTSASADAVILILTLPDFMVGFLISGGINAALLPALKQRTGKDRVLLSHYAGSVITLGFLGLALLLFIFADVIIQIFIPSVDFYESTGFITGFSLSTIALPVAALIGVSASYLNTKGRFSIPGLSVLIFNGTICIYLMLPFIDPTNLIYFGVVVVLASILRLLFQLGFMLETFQIYGNSKFFWPENFIRKFFEGTIGFGVMVAAIIVFRSFHALNGAGEMAAFNYAHKLFELPAALLIAPLCIVLLQILSGLDGNDKKTFADNTHAGILASFTLGCVATALGWIYMPLAVQIIFENGTMTMLESEHITKIALLLFTALPFFAILQASAVALSAQGNPRKLTINCCFGLISGVATVGIANFQGWHQSSAAIGFLTFNLIAAVLCLGSIFGWTNPKRSTLRLVLIMIIKISIAAAFFAYIQTLNQNISILMSVASSILASFLMVAINLPILKPLINMKFNKN